MCLKAQEIQGTADLWLDVHFWINLVSYFPCNAAHDLQAVGMPVFFFGLDLHVGKVC